MKNNQPQIVSNIHLHSPPFIFALNYCTSNNKNRGWSVSIKLNKLIMNISYENKISHMEEFSLTVTKPQRCLNIYFQVLELSRFRNSLQQIEMRTPDSQLTECVCDSLTCQVNTVRGKAFSLSRGFCFHYLVNMFGNLFLEQNLVFISVSYRIQIKQNSDGISLAKYLFGPGTNFIIYFIIER